LPRADSRGWDRARGEARLAKALIAVLAALCVPLVLFVGQVLAFPLPGSHWLESDAIFLVMALCCDGLGHQGATPTLDPSS